MGNSDSSPESPSVETIVELGRLGNLSDGVFAFAITLLVLDIRLADSTTTTTLAAGLADLAPHLLIYLISFVIIGGAWGSHQRMLGQIKHGDGVLVWFNLLSLLFITLIPVCSGILGRFFQEPLAIALFAADTILVQLSALWLWRHASKHKLLNPALDPRVVDSIARRYILTVAAFVVSLVFVLISPILVYIAWIGLFVFVFATDWLSWQQTLKRIRQSIPLGGVSQAHVTIGYGEGILRLHSGAAHNDLLDGSFGGGLNAHTERVGELLNVQLNKEQKHGFVDWRYPWAWTPANALDWNIALSPEIPLTLSTTIGAGEAKLDLTDLRVRDLTLVAEASSVTIHFPAQAGQTSLNLSGSLTSCFFYIPQGVAAQIHSTKAISGLAIDAVRFKMIEKEIHYRSADYDTAENRLDIHADLSLGSIQIF